MKTSTKRKAISKNKEDLIKAKDTTYSTEKKLFSSRDLEVKFIEGYDAGTLDQAEVFSSLYSTKDKDFNKECSDIEVPLHFRGGDWKWNFEKKSMSLVDKITWVLTAVNVAILISLIVKNL